MKNMGVGVNLFTNHLYYWGDAHRTVTMGPERAARLDDCGGALAGGRAACHPLRRSGYRFGTAVYRLVRRQPPLFRGRDLGRRSGKDFGRRRALRHYHGGAYSLKMDGEIGSLEVGKRADMAILAEDPIEVGAEGLKDIDVIGTMVDGIVHLNKARA